MSNINAEENFYRYTDGRETVPVWHYKTEKIYPGRIWSTLMILQVRVAKMDINRKRYFLG